MKIDFNEIPVRDADKFNGGEGVTHINMFNDGMAKILRLNLDPGAYIGYHQHVTNAEMIYVIEGHGSVNDDGVITPIKAGECSYCPKGHFHSLINDSDQPLICFAVVPEQP